MVAIHLQTHVFIKELSRDALVGTEIREHPAAMNVSDSPLTSSEVRVSMAVGFHPLRQAYGRKWIYVCEAK